MKRSFDDVEGAVENETVIPHIRHVMQTAFPHVRFSDRTRQREFNPATLYASIAQSMKGTSSGLGMSNILSPYGSDEQRAC